MIYGWMHGNGKTALFIKKRGCNSVTEDPKQAMRFPDKQACIDHWRAMHEFPEQAEHCITDGYLHFANNKGQLLIT